MLNPPFLPVYRTRNACAAHHLPGNSHFDAPSEIQWPKELCPQKSAGRAPPLPLDYFRACANNIRNSFFTLLYASCDSNCSRDRLGGAPRRFGWHYTYRRLRCCGPFASTDRCDHTDRNPRARSRMNLSTRGGQLGCPPRDRKIGPERNQILLNLALAPPVFSIFTQRKHKQLHAVPAEGGQCFKDVGLPPARE